MTLLSPRWIAGHLLAIVAVVTFVNFGLWQLRRHGEVQELQVEIAAIQALPIVEVEEAEMHRRVVAVGSFDPAAETRVLRSRSGESGERVLTPLVLRDGTAILVDRGWVLPGGDLPVPSGEVRTEGHLWPAETGSWMPDSLEPGQVVRRIDPAVVEPFVDYSFRGGYLIESLLREDDPPTIPAGPHLSYAVQWFAFTGIVVVGYPFVLRRAARRSRSAGEVTEGS